MKLECRNSHHPGIFHGFEVVPHRDVLWVYYFSRKGHIQGTFLGPAYTNSPYSIVSGARINCAFRNWEMQDGPTMRWIEARTLLISVASTADMTGLPQ